MDEGTPDPGREESGLDAWIDAALPSGAPDPERGFGDFDLVRRIGAGGMGEVWEARQRSLGGRRVALKLLRVAHASARELDAFRREARAASRMVHPGLVAIHAHGEHEGRPFLAMELVEGRRTLRDWLLERRAAADLPPEHDREVAELSASVAEALAACHRAGVVHRDLKPSNVLLTRDGRPRLVDFGVARLADEEPLTGTGDVPGTYAYMSPEQLAGARGSVDGRSDVFALGVLMYELLALGRPFAGDTTAQITRQILHEEPVPLRRLRSRIPQDLAVICGRAMEKERARRYASMDELAADLRRFLAHEPIHARPPGPLERALKWLRRHPALGLSGSTALAAFVVVAALLARNVAARRELAREVAAVQRLSAMQELEALIAEADDPEVMWPVGPEKIPVYEDWIRRARGLVAELPAHREQLAVLRAKAVPLTEEERADARERSPLYGELRRAQRELADAESALKARLTGEHETTPLFDRSKYPYTREELAELVERCLRGRRVPDDTPALALTLAQEVLARSQTPDRWQAQSLVARALFRLGRDGEALDASRRSLALAPEERREEARRSHEELATLVDHAMSDAGLRALEARVAWLSGQLEQLRERVDADLPWRYTTTLQTTSWWQDQLSELVEHLAGLLDPRTGLLSPEGCSAEHGWSVPRRLTFARRLRDDWTPEGVHGRRWAETLPAIRGRYELPDLPPQPGIVPVGVDPQSGLWEFWHVASGNEPDFDPRTGTRAGPTTGIVLVLIPGGEFWMGAQSADPSAPNFDPRANDDEGPVHRVRLAPFLLSKYEVTQAQWEHCTGRTPSYWSSGAMGWSAPYDDHPVEQVSWLECDEFSRAFDLLLPTEAQWEYACRAGDARPYSGMSHYLEMASFGNSADLSYQTRFEKDTKPVPAIDDGWGIHAPVGSYGANAFGMHDMYGNVYEWCEDVFESYRRAPEGPRGARRSHMHIGARVRRGHSYNATAAQLRSSLRDSVDEELISAAQGLRPARALDGAP